MTAGPGWASALPVHILVDPETTPFWVRRPEVPHAGSGAGYGPWRLLRLCHRNRGLLCVGKKQLVLS